MKTRRLFRLIYIRTGRVGAPDRVGISMLLRCCCTLNLRDKLDRTASESISPRVGAFRVKPNYPCAITGGGANCSSCFENNDAFSFRIKILHAFELFLHLVPLLEPSWAPQPEVWLVRINEFYCLKKKVGERFQQKLKERVFLSRVKLF